MAGYILYIEEPSNSSKIFYICAFIFMLLVGVDKQIKFRRVIGLEHMIRMKKFSTSDEHFKMGIFIPVMTFGIFMGFFKAIYTYNTKEASVSQLQQVLDIKICSVFQLNQNFF